MRATRRKLEAGPRPERFTTLPEEVAQDFERRLLKCKVIASKSAPTRETIQLQPNTIFVTVDADGVVGRILIDNALSETEESTILKWVDQGWDCDYWREYKWGRQGKEADSTGTVERFDAAEVPYKLEGEADVRAVVFDDKTRFAQTILNVLSRRVHGLLAKAMPTGGQQLLPVVGTRSDEARRHDDESGAEDTTFERLASLRNALTTTWARPQALQVTHYHSDAHSGLGQHFDSRACYGAIATVSLRCASTLVQKRGGSGGKQESKITLHPRSIYVLTGPARGDCIIGDATKNHRTCSCCWTHGIVVDAVDDFRKRHWLETRPHRRVALTLRSLTESTVDEATAHLESKRRRSN